MNYKVMQRPMFKMGGKAASQGTGITSGLDEKVNMSDGRANYAEGPTTYTDFLDRAFKEINVNKWDKYIKIDPKFYRPAEVDVLLGDSSKAKEKLKWSPKTSFKQLVSKMVKNDINLLRKNV